MDACLVVDPAWRTLKVVSSNGVVINRVWAMPNRWTFTIKPIAELVARYVGDGKGWVDPFAGMYSPAEFTNDLNPESNAMFHLEAIEFLKMLDGFKFRGILFDPPYSLRQVKEVYRHVGKKVTGLELGFGVERDIVQGLVSSGGVAITFGWNSIGMGKTHGFELVEILLVCHGRAHNDTIVTVERKVKEDSSK